MSRLNPLRVLDGIGRSTTKAYIASSLSVRIGIIAISIITVLLMTCQNISKKFASFRIFSAQAFSSQLNVTLQKELLKMQEKDQTARMVLMQNIENLAPEQCRVVGEIDQAHNPILKKIINEYGWPGTSLVGVEGTSAMWLLVQHQDNDLDFQKKCLDLLKKAAEANEASFNNYAYLVDRVKMHENLPQVYGTQWVRESGKFVLYPVEDIANLDTRRLKAGMSSMEEYKDRIKKEHNFKDEDFK